MSVSKDPQEDNFMYPPREIIFSNSEKLIIIYAAKMSPYHHVQQNSSSSLKIARKSGIYSIGKSKNLLFVRDQKIIQRSISTANNTFIPSINARTLSTKTSAFGRKMFYLQILSNNNIESVA